jgi:hypothetical protein
MAIPASPPASPAADAKPPIGRAYANTVGLLVETVRARTPSLDYSCESRDGRGRAKQGRIVPDNPLHSRHPWRSDGRVETCGCGRGSAHICCVALGKRARRTYGYAFARFPSRALQLRASRQPLPALPSARASSAIAPGIALPPASLQSCFALPRPSMDSYLLHLTAMDGRSRTFHVLRGTCTSMCNGGNAKGLQEQSLPCSRPRPRFARS